MLFLMLASWIFKNLILILIFFLSYKTGFPKLLVHRYPLDTVAGLHEPPKFCDVSVKKKAFS